MEALNINTLISKKSARADLLHDSIADFRQASSWSLKEYTEPVVSIPMFTSVYSEAPRCSVRIPENLKFCPKLVTTIVSSSLVFIIRIK